MSFFWQNPHVCGHTPLKVGSKVRFMLDDTHHAHGCVERLVPGGAWVALDNGEKLYVAHGKMRVENPTPPMNEMVAAVRKHAREHYTTGGWDYVVESFDDEEIVEIIEDENATTTAGAIRAVGSVVALLDDRRSDIEATRF